MAATDTRMLAQRLKETSEAARFLTDKVQIIRAERTWDVDVLGGEAWGHVQKALDSLVTAKVMCDMAARILNAQAESLMDEISNMEASQ